MKKLLYLTPLLVVPFLVLNNCTTIADGVTPVTVDKQKYLGQWYEIARLDHSFERGLSHVTANYSLKEDKGIKVLNKGYNQETNKWKEAEGKAYFKGDDTIGHLKVSFFGPFYGSYVIFDLDQQDYQWAYITSYNKDFLWLLSRTPSISQDRKDHFIQTAKDLGYQTDELIFVDHAATK